MTVMGKTTKPAWLAGDDISHRLRLTADTLESASNEIDNLRRALAWMRDHDPQLVDAAIQKFGLSE